MSQDTETSDVDKYLPIEQVIKEAKLGDMLEFKHRSYTLYALYLGEGKVINFDLKDKKATEAQIKERNLKEVCDGGKARVQGHENVAKALFNLSPKSPEEIVQAAKSYTNKVVPFEFDFRNSEYYCTLWRYGVGFSTQVAQQAWLPTEGSKAGHCTLDNKSSNLFGPEGYAKYKQLSMTDRGENSADQY